MGSPEIGSVGGGVGRSTGIVPILQRIAFLPGLSGQGCDGVPPGDGTQGKKEVLFTRDGGD